MGDISYDADQQRAIASDAAVVSAGAGSGKTSVLTRRYARLVIEKHIPVEGILALTFTRKAAAEMYTRIYEELRTHEADPFVRDQLSRFDRSVIATLDSFCSLVARDGCTRYGISPEFVIDETRLTELVDRQALSFAHEQADDPAMRRLVATHGFVSVWRDGFASIGRDLCDVVGARNFTESLGPQRAFVESEVERLTGAIRDAIATLVSLDPAAAKCVARAVEVAEPISRSGELTDADISALAAIKLQCGNSKKDDVAILKETVQAIREDADALLLARETVTRWHELEEATALAADFAERVVAAKRRSSLLSYHDVVALAIRILTEQTDLRDHYKRRFRAIMIDEFQDNNDEQKALLYLLAEREDHTSDGVPAPAALAPGKLFFVGDEKQSIYRFRGADVSVFRALSGELEQRSDDLTLHANYRSEPGLIRFFNALFVRVFGDATHTFDARFSPLRWRDATKGVHPRVERWELEKRERGNDEFLGDQDAQAFQIARRISSMIDDGDVLVRDGESSRPAEFGDIAILMRTTGNQIRLERMLRRFGIPHVSQAARSLFLEAPVYDMYQVLQLVIYPNDRAAYAGYLRSPLVNLSDEGLVAQLLSDQPLFDPADLLTSDDRDRLERARVRYATLVSMADRESIARLLHVIWYEWGYRYHLLRHREYLNYLEYYDLLRELALQFEDRGLASFLDEVRRHLGENNKQDELELLRPDANAVQLLTIHRSKGLEFPVVILAYGESAGRAPKVSDRPFYLSEHHGLVFNLGRLGSGAIRESAGNYFFTCESELIKAQGQAELRRLLYVAATRAESHLFLAGASDPPDASLSAIAQEAFPAAQDATTSDADAPIAISQVDWEPVRREELFAAGSGSEETPIADVARAYESLDQIDRSYPDLEVAVTTVSERAVERNVSRCPAFGVVPAPELSVDSIIEKHGLGAAFGTYCHHLIEHAEGSTLPVSLPPGLLPELPDRDLEAFVSAGSRLAAAFLASEIAASFATGIVEHEVAFTMHASALPQPIRACMDDAELLRGVIDLLVRFEDRAIVLDFKTDRELDPSHYAVQLEVYARAANTITGLSVQPMLYHLRSESTFLFDTSPDGSILEAHEYIR